ncbi:MAG: flagellar protein FlaG [Thermodesulfovibrionales bacterium]|nr:flagellar protein FlaG [Thermodesulfovibrionales bacterium]
MAEITLNTNLNNNLATGYTQKADIQKNVAVGVNPEDTSAFNASVMSNKTAVRPVNNNESKANNPQTSEKEDSNKKQPQKAVSKSVQLEFDKATGYPVIKFRDTKGNVVSQVPPEQFLKMRTVLGYNKRKEEIVDQNDLLYSKKIGLEQDTEKGNETQKNTSKDNNFSLYV